LYTQNKAGQLQNGGWAAEQFSDPKEFDSKQPITGVLFSNAHQHDSLAYEVQDLAQLSFHAFPEAVGIDSVSLYIQRSLVYTFQMTARMRCDPLSWEEIESALLRLSEPLDKLDLKPAFGIAVIGTCDQSDDWIEFEPENRISSLFTEHKQRLLATSRVGANLYLARARGAEWDVYIVVEESGVRPLINELFWYKQMIARAATKEVMACMERVRAALRITLQAVYALDPLSTPGRDFLDTINRLRKEVVAASSQAQDGRAKSRLVSLFLERAMPNSGAAITEESVIDGGLPIVIASEEKEFKRYYWEPLESLTEHVSALGTEAQERIHALNEIVSLGYNLKIQVQLRWLQILAVALTLVGVVVGLVALFR
jgi:hypothetical protein